MVPNILILGERVKRDGKAGAGKARKGGELGIQGKRAIQSLKGFFQVSRDRKGIGMDLSPYTCHALPEMDL
jgi:hypothetical protein